MVEYKTIQRIETHLVREGEAGIKISNAQDVVKYMEELQDSDIEKFITVFLDNNNRILCEAVLSIGTINQATVFPREVIKIALLTGAGGIILVHNHPGGNLESSKEDRELTGQIKRAGELFNIGLLDHLIITANGYHSMKEKGEI